MCEEPDFTIVTPNLNYGKFLTDCIESSGQQKGVTVEHLVIDGLSTDDSRKVADRFSHVTWSSEKDDGMSQAINRGLKRARGKWLMWLNADDRLKPGALAEVKRFIDEHGNADVIYGAWDFVDEDLKMVKRMNVFPLKPKMLSRMGCYIGSTACFFRRDLVEEGFMLNEDFHFLMDGELYCRLAKAGRQFRYLPVVLAEFRLHAENQSFRHRKGGAIDHQLRLGKQYSETWAIRRTYGWPGWRDPNLTMMMDGIIYCLYRIQKACLRLIYRGGVRLPE